MKKSRLFAKNGLVLLEESSGLYVARGAGDGACVRLLLPDGLRMERNALANLGVMAGLPGVVAISAFPDIHAVDSRCVGTAVASTGVWPSMAGSDIGCAIRASVSNIREDDFAKISDDAVKRLSGPYLEGRRNIPLSFEALGLLIKGLPGEALGALAKLPDQDFWRMGDKDSEGIATGFLSNKFLSKGRPSEKWLPEHAKRDVFRDASLGSAGRGNHFVEFSAVEEVFDEKEARSLGVSVGSVLILTHSGSREWGFFTANEFSRRASARRDPSKKAHPEGWAGLDGADAEDYVSASDTACLFAWLNRVCLERMALLELGISAKVITDEPHNGVWREPDGSYLTRKGSNSARRGDVAVIAGSMGSMSHLVIGRGSVDFMDSSSHGAGRAVRRGMAQGGSAMEMGRCVSLSKERKVQEGPGNYKDIETVMAAQEGAGLFSRVASLRPLLTFKS